MTRPPNSPAPPAVAEINLFMRSRVILTAAELDLFTTLANQPATADELAQTGGLDPRATRRLLDCLVTFGLLTTDEAGRYRPTPDGHHLADGHAGSLRPWALHLNNLWLNWSALTEQLRTGRNPALTATTDRSDRELAAFIGAMHALGRDTSTRLAAAVDLTGCRRLLDIGGASGTYTIAFLNRAPDLRAVLFDLERVVPLAAERLEAAGLLDRVDLVAGDYDRDELPPGCDLALLSAIVHQNGRDANRSLYTKVHRALTPGGRLIIRDHFMDPSRTVPAAGALFAINMLVATPAGDTYTWEETEADLRAAGFGAIHRLRQGEAMDSLVEAIKA